MGNNGFSVGHVMVLAMVGLFVIYIVFCATLGDPLVESQMRMTEDIHKQLLESGRINSDSHYIFVNDGYCNLYTKDVETTQTKMLLDDDGNPIIDPFCFPRKFNEK